jgi:type II secretory pathway pseudopilin PulG
MSGTPGVIAVSTTACTASSVILFSRATTGGTPGQVSITAQSTSGFTLTSTGNETSTFNWLIIN